MRPVTVAIRTAPIEVQGACVGATWVMTRLVDPLFEDRSLRGYQLATGLALGGIALAFALTAGLARTVRRQADERDRLQTELRRSERLAALGKLLAGVAHEVRNPLAGIRSTAQLWQRGVVGLDEESLGGLVHEVDRLEEIVSRLLQFSRADGQDLAPGDLNAVLAEAARLAAGSSRARASASSSSSTPTSRSRRWRLRALLQVFRNLTTNASRRCRRAGPSACDPARSVAPAIEASVTDTGPGLAPKRSNTSSSRSTRPKPRGPGWDSPSPARSSWPTAAISAPPTASRGPVPSSPSSSPSSRPSHNGAHAVMNTPAKVLVADDDRTIRRNLVLLLRSEGYETLEAADGDQALARIDREAPDAVLLDLKMPGRDGMEVLAELGPALADLPVIVVTALGGSAAAIEAMRRGAYDYLTKPFDLDEVAAHAQTGAAAARAGPEVKSLRAERRATEASPDDAADEPELVGQSAAMREVFKAIGLAAATDAPVLILGESGTGKELVAPRLAPALGSRGRPVRPRQLRGAARGLVESELFGHERGAFTGADRRAGPVRARRQAARSSSTRSASSRFDPGQAPARPPAARVRARRRDRDPPHRRPRDLRDPSRPGQRGRRRAIPRGPLLPPERRPDRDPAAPRPARGHRAPGRAHPQTRRAAARLARAVALARGPPGHPANGPGRATSANWRTPWPGP